MTTFTHNDNCFLADGKPYTVISGAMHYFRIHPDYWRDRLLKMKECGFNTVETYTCWNLHEPREGEFDFSGGLDLGRYLSLAEELGLNIILRPGPYICAEWDMGGLPAWLLNYHEMEFRCFDEGFIEKVTNYYDRLLPIVKPHLLSNGGGVIMMQIENEYGSYGNDHDYMRAVAEIYHRHGIDCQLFTSDGATMFMLSGGTLEEYPCVANFGSDPAGNFAALDAFRQNQPKMCGEYWVGWFDHWYDVHHTRDPKEVAALFREMLEEGASLNFYMFHGGTNFGFMNGANYYDAYEPTITSYDYCALLSEAGDMTPAYYEVRKVIEAFRGEPLGPVTAKNTPKKAYGAVELTEMCDIFTAAPLLTEPVRTAAPKFTESIGQYHGFTLYSTQLQGPREDWELNIDAVHDRAVVWADGKYQGYIERSRHKDEIRLPLPKGERMRLDILCENMGRVNYGPRLKDRKGLRGIRFGLQYHFGWEMYPLDLKDLSPLRYRPFPGKTETAAFLRGTLSVEGAPCDTFLRTDGFHKGVAIVNGFNLGRYYNDAGPQKTLYVPAPVLREGENEIIVFETDRAEAGSVYFTDTPELG